MADCCRSVLSAVVVWSLTRRTFDSLEYGYKALLNPQFFGNKTRTQKPQLAK